MERITSWFVATTLLGCIGRLAVIFSAGLAGYALTSGLASQIFLLAMLCAPLVMATFLLAQSWPSLAKRSVWAGLWTAERFHGLSDLVQTDGADRGVVLCLDRAHLRRIGMRHGPAATLRCVDLVEAAVLAKVRPGDVVARLNESEICLWLRNVTDDQALTIGARLCRLVPVALDSGPTLLIAPVPGAVLSDPPVEVRRSMRTCGKASSEDESLVTDLMRTGTDG